MDRKEAILRIKDHMEHHGIGKYPHLKLKEALDMAIAALSQPNEPLTLKQLREMDGKAAYLPETNCWGLITKNPFVPLFTFPDGEQCNAADWYEEVGPAYARPPAHIDREGWEKPCGMCGGKTTLYQHTNTTKLFMNTFGEAATLVTECMACPPYADCCMKGISANSAFKINFCPECGRPLTEEAWAELEKRLRG